MLAGVFFCLRGQWFIYNALLAQLVEQLPFKEMVPGSNPGRCTNKKIPFADAKGIFGKKIFWFLNSVVFTF